MRFWSKRLTLAAAGIAAGWLMTTFISNRAEAQAVASRPPTPKETAGHYFKNVQTEALKGLSTDDFLSAMGVITDSLGLDCADCHPGAGTDKVDWVVDTPPKRTARKMIDMVQAINKTHFAGAQEVTCFTCHHAREKPSTTVSLDALYSAPNMEKDDIVTPDKEQPAATAVLDRYVAALGGAAKLAGLKSYVMHGVSIGYEGLGGNGQFTVYANAPNQRATDIRFPDHPDRAPSIWTFDGKVGWVTAPRGLLGEYQLEGNNEAGAAFEAGMSFPQNIKSLFTNWRTGSMESIGDNDYLVVEGISTSVVAKLYFDAKTSLLTRVIRFVNSPVGRVPIQVGYSDYRDVNGIKFPMALEFLWLDGRYNAEIKSVDVNTAIDPKKFVKP